MLKFAHVKPIDLHSYHGRRVVVLGDLMLDRFIHGAVRRLSPEAPVPVLLREREECMPGGAGNVARNIAALGGTAVLIGAAGEDAAGRTLREILRNEARIEDRTVALAGMATIEKIRYHAQQHLLRVDSEAPGEMPAGGILPVFERALAEADAAILSDYAKGLLSRELTQAAIAAARARGVPLVVDPKCRDLSRYNGASLLTPNRGEAEDSTGIAIHDDVGAEAAGRAILENLPATPAVIITRGDQGMSLVERRAERAMHLRTQAREVYDVSGAGDTVIAVLGLSLAAGMELSEAVHLANLAAGIVVGKPGTAAVQAADLRRALQEERVVNLDEKIVTLDEAQRLAARWRQRGERVGFTNGCFDLIHPGHIALLQQAREHCDRLIVGLNADSSVRRLKGPERPVQEETARAIVLASLSMVDLVILFEQDTPLELIERLRPEALIKGQDYSLEEIVGAREVLAYGGEVVRARLAPGHSTSKLLRTRMAKSGILPPPASLPVEKPQ